MDNKQEQLIRDRIRESEAQAKVPGFDSGMAWDKLEQQLDQPEKKKIPLYYWAAAASLLLLVTIAFWWPASQSPETPVTVTRNPQPLKTTTPAPAAIIAQDSLTPAPVLQRPFTAVPRSSGKQPPAQDTTQTIILARKEAPARDPAPEPASPANIAAAPDPRILKRDMPQVSLAELLQDEAAGLTPPRKDEPTLHIGIRKTAKVLLNEQGVAQHAITIKL